MDSYEVCSVRDFIVASIQNSKPVKSKSTVKIKKAARLNQCNTQKNLHRVQNDDEFELQRYSPEFEYSKQVKSTKTKELTKGQKANIDLKQLEQDSIEFTPNKSQIPSPNYNNFVEKH